MQHFDHRRRILLLAVSLMLAAPPVAGAQTAFRNTSPARPLTVEDAAPLERAVLNAFLASASWRSRDKQTVWGVTPGLAYGIAARTQVDLTVPGGYHDAPVASESGIAAVAVSLLYALNVETRSLPAFAVRAGTLIPVGGPGITEAHESIRGIVTRSFSWGRVHFNHEYTFGAEREPLAIMPDLARNTTGLSIDRSFPIRGLLLGAEVVARRPLVDSVSSYWSAGGAARYQLTRSSTVEAGASRGLNESGAWTIWIGAGWMTARGAVIPGMGRWGR